MLRHVPPTAVLIKPVDLWRGLLAAAQPDLSLDRLRIAVQAQTGSPACYLVSSGRAALTCILLGLKRLSVRSKVLVPAYSCPTVVQAVLAAGLEPLFCDVSPETLDFDRAALGRLWGPDLLAIVPVHLYGWAQDIGDLLAAGKQYGFFVVEDAAQAFGAFSHGKMVGTSGDAGLYSLGRGKCLPAGQGGVIVASEGCATAIGAVVAEVKAEAGHLPRFDWLSLALSAGYALATRPTGWWLVVRTPLNPAGEGMDIQSLPPIRLGRLSATVAGFAASILGRLNQVQAVRRQNAERLMAGLAEFGFVSVPAISAGAQPAFLRLPVVVESQERAERLFAELWRRGIGVSRSYSRSLPDLYSGALGSAECHFPGAAHLARCLLTLPTHAYLKDDDFDRTADAFRAL